MQSNGVRLSTGHLDRLKETEPTFPAPSSSASPNSTPTYVSNTLSTSLATLTPTSSSAGGSSNLSTAAKAGIGVGASIGAILVLGLLGYVSYFKGKQSKDKFSMLDSAVYTGGYMQQKPKTTHSIQISAPFEMDAQEYAMRR